MVHTTLISSGFKLGTTPPVVPRRQGHPSTPIHRNSTSVPQSSPRSVYFENYILEKNKNVSRLELEKLIHTYNNDISVVRMMVENLDYMRETEKESGKYHFEAGPVVEVLSTAISLHNIHVGEPLAIYGRIYIEFHHIFNGEIMTRDLFNRGRNDPEILCSIHNLTFTSPYDRIHESYLCIPLHETKIVVDLWDAHQNVVFARDSFFVLDANKDDYEQLHLKKLIHGTSGSIAVRYLSMVFGILCCVEVQFFRMERNQDKDNIRRVVNVYGEIVARYGNTHGNYNDEEFTLFKKLSHEFEQVVLGGIYYPNNMRLPRCWLRMPAYASLIVDFNLFDFDTKKPIFKGVAELVPDFNPCFEAFRADDIVMNVYANWEIHKPGRCRLVSVCEEEKEEEEIEVHVASDTEEEEEEEIEVHVVSDMHQDGEVHMVSDTKEEEDEDEDDDEDEDGYEEVEDEDEDEDEGEDDDEDEDEDEDGYEEVEEDEDDEVHAFAFFTFH